MKEHNKCPKCDCSNIIRIPGKTSRSELGNNIPKPTSFGIMVSDAVPVSRYLCSSCGYLEDWIDNKEDISRIVKDYG